MFDRDQLIKNRDRVSKNFNQYNFLLKENYISIIDSISYFKKDFNTILEIGARKGLYNDQLKKAINGKLLIQSECSLKMLKSNLNQFKIACDDEKLCFKENSFDLIISNCNLHFINDIKQNLIEIRRLLNKSGLFLAKFFGGQTLKELRNIFIKLN